MADYKHLIEEDRPGGIRLLTLNRPENLNSWNAEMRAEMRDAVEGAAADPGLRCLIITGAGRAFSAGEDVTGMADLTAIGTRGFRAAARGIHGVFDTVEAMEVPVIAAIDGVAAGGGRAGAGLGRGAAQQPAESFLAQDVADGGAAQRGAFLAEPGADLIDRQALAAQLDDPGAGGVFPRGALAAGDAGRREQGEPACPQVADQRRECVAGVAGGAGGLLQRGALIEVGAQRLVAPLVYLPGQQLPAWSWGRYSGHGADLPQVSGGRRYLASVRFAPGNALPVPACYRLR